MPVWILSNPLMSGPFGAPQQYLLTDCEMVISDSRPPYSTSVRLRFLSLKETKLYLLIFTGV